MMDNSQGSNLKRLDVPNDSRKNAVKQIHRRKEKMGKDDQFSYEHTGI